MLNDELVMTIRVSAFIADHASVSILRMAAR
jgi:hypothetical protein